MLLYTAVKGVAAKNHKTIAQIEYDLNLSN